MRKIAVGVLHWVAKHAASSYIAGPEIKDGLRVCRQAAERGWSSTICPWDGPRDLPEHVAANYQAALNSITSEDIDSYLSVKVPSIGYDFGILKELMNIARRKAVRIHFDSLAPDTASRSIALLEKAIAIYPNIGYTLPSCWLRSAKDAEKIVEWRIPVRLVKGQWPDPAEPNIDPGSNYLKIIDILAGRALHVAVATHDISLAKEALTRLKAAGTSCELEQLYGLPMRGDSVAKPLGVPVRVYVPYGHAYLAYSLSTVRRRPIILIWLIRDFLKGIRNNSN